MPFISLLDDRARPKGSRDPLGFELVWTCFGRKVVGNLTTITSSLESFAVALLGFHWANEVCANTEEDKQKAVRETFLRYEQIAAYLRYYCDSKSVMGITRVTERVGNEDKLVYFGIGSNEQILSNQASYGLWGLYSTAMRDTGLVDGNERVITSKGLEIANQIEKRLNKSDFIDILNSSSVSKEKLQNLSDEYMKAITSDSVADKLLELLMRGPFDHRLQKDLWQMTRSLFNNNLLPIPGVGALEQYTSQLLKTDLSLELKNKLKDIIDIERVLVTLNNIFHYTRVKDGLELNEIVTNLENVNYNYSYLPKQLPAIDFPRKKYIENAFFNLLDGNYHKVIHKLVELNKEVMQQRNGASWVEIESSGKIRVRIKTESFSLLKEEELQLKWDYDYFLGSFLSMADSYLRSA